MPLILHSVFVIHGGVVQMATILFYLTDVEEGGETIFPLEGRYGVDLLKMTGFNYKSCTTGFQVIELFIPRMTS